MKKPNKAFKIRKDFLPISKPLIGKNEIKLVLETLKGGWITTGAKSFEFERLFKNFTGAKHAVALSSCTAALELALASFGIGEGDEVILSPMTFVSQANVIVHLKAVPVFADINPRTLNIDPDEIERKITDKTRAIIMTHFGGQPCERKRILEIASRRGLHVIEDAAHALGSAYEGKMIGSDPDTVSCFSFYPIKNITTAEGGMLVTGRDDIAEKARILSLHGLSTNAWERYKSSGTWEYDVIDPGYKFNMPDILAAIGVAQMKSLKAFNRKRESLAKRYMRLLSGMDEITLPEVIGGIRHSWQIFPILLNPAKCPVSRNELIERLKELKIGTSVHFKPIHLFTFYREKFGLSRGDLPNSEDVFKNVVSIPIFPGMSGEDCDYVVDGLKKIFSAS